MQNDDEKVWRELVALTGSPERAQAVLKVVIDSRSDTTARQLTDSQRKLYLYLASGKPVVSQRQLGRDAGFDHPQKMLAALGGLVVKGYVIARTLPVANDSDNN